MELRELTEDVEVIQSLGTYPNQEDGLTPEQLKEKFDTGARIIKQYLNSQVVPAFAAHKENVDKLVKGMEDGTFVGPPGPQGPQGPAGNGLGVQTPEGGAIFNDYANNRATAKFATAFGSGAKALAEASIAGGTTDDSHIKSITGVDIGILTDDLIAEVLGERGIRLRNNLKADPSPTVFGVAGISHGTGTRGYTALSASLGAGTEAGSKGFYIHKVTVPENGDNITVSLSTEHKPYYKYAVLGATIERNKTATWSDSTAKQLLSALKAGDQVNIILKKIYCLCESIVSVNAESGVITLTNTGGITKQDVEDATVFDSLITAETKMLALVPYQFTLAVPTKPDVGTAEIHFAGLATGLGSIAAATLAQAHGSMNLAAAQYGFVVGRDNVGGYAAFVSGEKNKGLGYYALVGGLLNEALADYSVALNYNTKANALGAISTGSGTVVDGKYSIGGGLNGYISGNYGLGTGMKYNILAHFGITSGMNNTVQANCASAFGVGLFTAKQYDDNGVNTGKGYAQTLVGQFNAYQNGEIDEALFAVGNGTSDTNRGNAFSVLRNGSIVLSSGAYGDKLPSNPVEGQLYFLKV